MASSRRDATTRGFSLLAAAGGLALVLASAGCDSGSAPAGDDPGGPAATRTAWPQPVDGRLTTQMCDLLGPDDYAAVDAIATVFDERTLTPKAKPTGLSCHSVGETWLTLNLQPDAVSGGLYYESRLRAQRKSPGASAELRQNVVPGADASYYGAEMGGHELVVRRRGLIVGLHFGFLNDRIDQFAAATKLAGLVLQRTQAGMSDTGEPHHLTMTVTGRPARPGPVDIQYLDPNTVELVKESGVTLPWTKTVDFAWYGVSRPSITMYVVLRKPTLNKYLNCKIVIDGKTVDEPPAQLSLTTCRGEYSDTR
jgi:hypothetical protein